MIRVAFQGELGAFSEMAARRQFADAQLMPCTDFESAAAALFNHVADYAVLPVENTVAGAVQGTLGILADGRFATVDELWLPIHHCVLGLPSTTLDEVRVVLSHPVALAQCGNWLRRHPALRAHEWYDTAGAAKHIAASHDPTIGAIASRVAADRYRLTILAENVEDRSDNQTRFAILALR
jgi:prephenate dehydratase